MRFSGLLVAATVLACSGTSIAQQSPTQRGSHLPGWDPNLQMHGLPGSNVLSEPRLEQRNPLNGIVSRFGTGASWTMFTPSSAPGKLDYVVWSIGCLSEMDAVHYFDGLRPLIKDVVGGRPSYTMGGMLDAVCKVAVTADGRYAWQACTPNSAHRGSITEAETAARAVRTCESRTKQVCYPEDGNGVVRQHKEQFGPRPASYWAHVESDYQYQRGHEKAAISRAVLEFSNSTIKPDGTPTPQMELYHKCTFGEWSMARERERVMGR